MPFMMVIADSPIWAVRVLTIAVSVAVGAGTIAGVVAIAVVVSRTKAGEMGGFTETTSTVISGGTIAINRYLDQSELDRYANATHTLIELSEILHEHLSSAFGKQFLVVNVHEFSPKPMLQAELIRVNGSQNCTTNAANVVVCEQKPLSNNSTEIVQVNATQNCTKNNANTSNCEQTPKFNSSTEMIPVNASQNCTKDDGEDAYASGCERKPLTKNNTDIKWKKSEPALSRETSFVINFFRTFSPWKIFTSTPQISSKQGFNEAKDETFCNVSVRNNTQLALINLNVTMYFKIANGSNLTIMDIIISLRKYAPDVTLLTSCNTTRTRKGSFNETKTILSPFKITNSTIQPQTHPNISSSLLDKLNSKPTEETILSTNITQPGTTYTTFSQSTSTSTTVTLDTSQTINTTTFILLPTIPTDSTTTQTSNMPTDSSSSSFLIELTTGLPNTELFPTATSIIPINPTTTIPPITSAQSSQTDLDTSTLLTSTIQSITTAFPSTDFPSTFYNFDSTGTNLDGGTFWTTAMDTSITSIPPTDFPSSTYYLDSTATHLSDSTFWTTATDLPSGTYYVDSMATNLSDSTFWMTATDLPMISIPPSDFPSGSYYLDSTATQLVDSTFWTTATDLPITSIPPTDFPSSTYSLDSTATALSNSSSSTTH